jgi:hypothetical protein
VSTPQNNIDVSIIIVNWNSRNDVQKCIASILEWTSGIRFEIVVIDSGSFDGVGEMLGIFYPDVRFIQSNENIGFAKANNIAFKLSSGRNILFLNPDTEIESRAVEHMSHWLDVGPDVGVVGARLLNTDRSVQASCVRAFPGILNQLLDSDALRSSFPRARMWGTGLLFRTDGTPGEVDAVSGACLMIKRLVFEAVGMFSNDYFMYSEDIDLCFKVHESGWKTNYVPSAVVVHHGGTSSSKSNVSTFSSVMMLESRWRFFRKTKSISYCWLYRFAMCLSSIVRIGLAVVVWPIYGLGGRSDLIWNVIKKWTAILRWTVGGERWSKRR